MNVDFNDKSAVNPYALNSGIWDNFENRFKRVVDFNGRHHAFWCFCAWCDIVKQHVHSEYKVVEVDEPWNPSDHRPTPPGGTPEVIAG